MVSVWQEALPESLEAILELFHKACRLCIRVTPKGESSLSKSKCAAANPLAARRLTLKIWMLAAGSDSAVN